MLGISSLIIPWKYRQIYKATARKVKRGKGGWGPFPSVPVIIFHKIKFFKVNIPLTVEITVANDVTIGTTVDSDISFGVSDGTRFIGFYTCDKGNYGTNAPCYKMEGLSGTTISSKKVGPYTTKPSQNFYPGQFLFTIKLNERWGSCYTAHDGGFVTTAAYSNRLMISKGLTLEIYQEDKSEKVGIRFISLHQGR